MARVRPAGSWSRWSMTGARFPTRRSGFGRDWGSFENCEHAQREALFPPYFANFPWNTQSIPASNRLRPAKKSLPAGHISNFQTAPGLAGDGIFGGIGNDRAVKKNPGRNAGAQVPEAESGVPRLAVRGVGGGGLRAEGRAVFCRPERGGGGPGKGQGAVHRPLRHPGRVAYPQFYHPPEPAVLCALPAADRHPVVHHGGGGGGPYLRLCSRGGGVVAGSPGLHRHLRFFHVVGDRRPRQPPHRQ